MILGCYKGLWRAISRFKFWQSDFESFEMSIFLRAYSSRSILEVIFITLENAPFPRIFPLEGKMKSLRSFNMYYI